MTKEILKEVEQYFTLNDSWIQTYVVTNPVWVAHISNGEDTVEVIDDFDRPNTTNSWTRLKNMVESTDLYIEKFFLKWRKKKVLIAENPRCLFFTRRIEADAWSQNNYHFFLTGIESEGIIQVDHWRLPSLDYRKSEERPIECVSPEFLIWNTCTNQDTQIEK